ncbi:MAG: hypothetical protein Tsb0013_07530 [Phycisphaerales bacterium]
METQICKTCLFGGVLFAAGLASAQSFSIQDDRPLNPGAMPATVASQAYAFASLDGVTNYAFELRPDDINHTVTSASGSGELVASNSFQPTELRGDLDWNGSGSATGGVLASVGFQVDVNATGIASWDVSGMASFGASSYFGVYTYDAGGFIIPVFERDFDGSISGMIDPLSGIENISLEAGRQYIAEWTINGVPNVDAAQFVSLQLIPAPGAAGLLAVAGFVGVRRRR